jgi:hypothetical protein
MSRALSDFSGNSTGEFSFNFEQGSSSASLLVKHTLSLRAFTNNVISFKLSITNNNIAPFYLDLC